MKSSKPFNTKEFLDNNRLDYKETDSHYQVNCFVCGETRHRLGINKESGKWHCFNCNARANKASALQYALNNKGNIKTNQHIEKDEQEEKCTIKPDLHLKFFNNLKDSNNISSPRQGVLVYINLILFFGFSI